MSPRAIRGLALLVAVAGVAVTLAGIALAVRSFSAWRETVHVQHGPRVLAEVVAAGHVRGHSQRATLRYRDLSGHGHEVVVGYPLGLADRVTIGESTSVRYDPRRPGQAELAGHPRHSWQDIALALALTAVAAGVWLHRVVTLLNAGRRAEEEPEVRLGQAGTVERLPAPRRPRRHAYGALAAVSALLIVGGKLAVQLAALDQPQQIAFPPLPVLPAHHGSLDLPAILTAPPPQSGPLVTPASAGAIVAAAWQYRDRALAQHDAAELRAVDAEPLATIDVNRLETGSAPERLDPTAGDLQNLTAYTPRQTQWPLRLLGEAVTTSGATPSLEAMVLTRTGPAAPWRIALDAVTTQNATYRPAVMPPILDADGYDVLPPLAWVSPDQLVPALARYWQSFRDSGSAPDGGVPFSSGYWTTDYASSIANEQDRTDRHNGLRAHVVYDDQPATGAGVWSFGVSGSWTLVCSPMHETKTWAGPAHQDPDRQKWGADIAPGVYKSITGEYVRQPCFVTPPSPAAGVAVFGADAWQVALRGER